MSAIKNVSLIGGGGRLGSFILEKLVASNKFNVQVVKRVGSLSTFPEGLTVVEADYNDIESLKSAFTGQDAIVSIVGDAGVLSQKTMFDAAAAVGVKRFLPSNFGSNMANPLSRKLPVFSAKVQVEDYIIEKSRSTDLTYSFVYNGGLIDFTLKNKVIINFTDYAPSVYDTGAPHFSATSMPTIGDAVVGVLSHPTETKNRAVYVSEVITSQNELIALAKELDPDKPWVTKSIDMDAAFNAAVERLAQGAHDLPTIIPVLLKSIVTPEYGVKFDANDNELLGIKTKGNEYLKELIAPLLGQVSK